MGDNKKVSKYWRKENVKDTFQRQGDVLIIEQKYDKAKYALSSQLNMSYKVIKSCISGWGIPKYVAIKAITQMLHHSLHENELIVKWSPTHQHIATMNNERDIDNVNLVLWIIYREERVKLSNSKVEKKVMSNLNNPIKYMLWTKPFFP